MYVTVQNLKFQTETLPISRMAMRSSSTVFLKLFGKKHEKNHSLGCPDKSFLSSGRRNGCCDFCVRSIGAALVRSSNRHGLFRMSLPTLSNAEWLRPCI